MKHLYVGGLAALVAFGLIWLGLLARAMVAMFTTPEFATGIVIAVAAFALLVMAVDYLSER